MQAIIQNRYKFCILILSLLINLLFMLPFILLKIEEAVQETIFVFHNEQDHDEDTKTNLQEEREELIQHILSSGMTAPDPTQEVQHDQDITEPLMPMQSHSAVSLDAQEVAEHPTKQEDSENMQVEAPIEEEESDTTGEGKEEMPLKEEEPSETLQQETALVQDIVERELKKEQIIKKQPSPKKKARKQTSAVQKQSPGISLGAIAQGFLKSMQQEEGLNNPPHMDADTLAAHQYATKVWNIIKNSFKADENMLHLSQNVDTVAYLVITVMRNGQLVDIHLESNKMSIGLRQIEALITEHAKKAGLFPPLPRRFAQDQKTFTYPIHIQGQEGYHSYRLSYGA